MIELPQIHALSYNIHHGRGEDGALSLRRIAAEIEESGADLVGLQEVDRHFGERSGFADQAAELARLLGMHAVFGAAITADGPAPDGPPAEYGLALLTRRPVLEWASRPLPGTAPDDDSDAADDEPRVLLSALVEVGGHRLRLLTTHFSAESEQARRRQTAAVVRAVEATDGPLVLTGDFNATADAPAVKPLFDLLEAAGEGPTFPSGEPAVRIDHVLVRGVRVLSARVADTAGSDHRPVVAELALA